MILVWQYGEASGYESWKGLSWGMVSYGSDCRNLVHSLCVRIVLHFLYIDRNYIKKLSLLSLEKHNCFCCYNLIDDGV